VPRASPKDFTYHRDAVLDVFDRRRFMSRFNDLELAISRMLAAGGGLVEDVNGDEVGG
jgi:hypothetical protein